MQITLAQAGDNISIVLSQFERDFPFPVPEVTKCVESLSQSLLHLSISKLKAMTNFLAQAFTVPLEAPKRNSKISLSKWVAQVLLSAVELQDDKLSEVSVTPEIEVLEPESAPIYKVRLVTDDQMFSEHRLSQIPPYLVHDRKLFHKEAFYSFLDSTHYVEVPAEYLSNVEGLSPGTLVELLTENLVAVETIILGIPPLHLITKQGGVYKRDRRQLIALHSIVKYSQVICEDLSNIAIA